MKMSAVRTGKTLKEEITLDTGATCSIVRLNMAKKVKLENQASLRGDHSVSQR